MLDVEGAATSMLLLAVPGVAPDIEAWGFGRAEAKLDNVCFDRLL